MVDACLKGAYRLGVMQPQYRCWLPLSKIGETMAILHIMRCNLSLDRGDLAQSVHDAQAAVALTIIPGASASSPKAMSAMWFAQACRALGRVSVVRFYLPVLWRKCCRVFALRPNTPGEACHHCLVPWGLLQQLTLCYTPHRTEKGPIRKLVVRLGAQVCIESVPAAADDLRFRDISQCAAAAGEQPQSGRVSGPRDQRPQGGRQGGCQRSGCAAVAGDGQLLAPAG